MPHLGRKDMVLTICFQCDKSYPRNKASCPHCECHNFFEDKDTQILAIQALTQDLNSRAEEEKKEKLREFNRLRFWQNPPWWMKFLLWLKERLA